MVLAHVNPDLVSTAADVVFPDFRCNAKKWSCEVVGSYKCSGAIGPWNLLLLDFRSWHRQPSRRWCLLSYCYCTEPHKRRVVISEAFRKATGPLLQSIRSPSMIMPEAIQVCCVRRALLFWSLIWHCTASTVLLKFDASHQAVIVLLVLEATLVLPIARVRLLKL